MIRKSWDRLSTVPGGKRLFSLMIGRAAPYTGSVGAQVVELRDGFGRVLLADRPKVRNHLDSVHAIALANLGEMASGVTMMYSLAPEMRAILTDIEIEYLKKARGPLSATCTLDPITEVKETRTTLRVEIRNADDEVVCLVKPTWKLGPRRSN